MVKRVVTRESGTQATNNVHRFYVSIDVDHVRFLSSSLLLVD